MSTLPSISGERWPLGSKTFISPDTPENLKIRAEVKESWGKTTALQKYQIFSGTAVFMCAVMIITCIAKGCFSEEKHHHISPGCESICSHGVRVAIIVIFIFCCLGCCVSSVAKSYSK